MPSSLPIIVMVSCLLCCLPGCMMDFTRELVSSQRFAVEGFVVEEQIYRTNSFPDPRFERIYYVERAVRTVEVGRYTDEGATGIATPPRLIGDWLVVMSGAHLFFWQPQEEVRHFYPYVADGWIAYAQERGLNGHYDYVATLAEIEGSKWQITYACLPCLTNHPRELHFVSTDSGQTFRLD